MLKKLKEKFILFLAKIVARPLLILYRNTLSVQISNRHYVESCRKDGENILYSFWHEYMILPLLIHEKQGVYVLVSQHFDGEIIATILKVFGYPSIRGSSTRGGDQAYKLIKLNLERKRFEVAFTPDGPLGPRRQAKMGIIRLAAETGAPIIPLAVAANRYRRIKSWDRLFLIFPFAKCALVYHKPLYVPKNANLESYAEKLSAITDALDQEAEKCLPH
ncbi:MAG: lysophospholipid acyltransferase family protein [Calditrichia bacterium]|nr:lysophospholipid acyltransferase family protein [Calditrichia bacterium]MCK5455234.1 lysophospholipid acyltransferase family protein [Calditrichia bacterium]